MVKLVEEAVALADALSALAGIILRFAGNL